MALCISSASAALADDVDVTVSTTSGLNLDAFTGTTARIFPGITVSNTGTLMPGGTFSGVAATTQAWTLTNLGTVDSQLGNGVTFNLGGTVNNEGRIDSGFNGVRILTGGTLANAAGAVVEAGASAVWISGGGTVTNAGQLIGLGIATAVSFDGGGTITNQAGALIEGNGLGNAVAIRGGTTRILTNHGTIRDLAGGFAAGVAIQGGTLTNSATGLITGSYNAVWTTTGAPTAIINAGQLTATTAGAIELQHGGTIQNSGTIQGALGIEVLPGFMVTDASTAITNSGTITGNGGTAIDFAVGTNSLTLQTGSVINGNVLGGPNADSLILSGTGAETISKFVNFETLSMQGETWTLTGTGAFTSSAAVQSGTLMVHGQLTSPTLTIQNGATLGGTGTVVGAVVNNGNIAPGASIGTLNITGTYQQASGSTYTVEVSTSAADLINLTGAATIQASTGVNVLVAPGLYTVGQRYTILTASGGVTGTYATLADNAPFVDFVLVYEPNNVFLDVLFASAGFTSVAQTPNQRAVASAAETLVPGNPVFDALLMLDTPNALRAFDLLSGEIHASIRSVLVDDSRFIREGIFARLRQSAGPLASAFGPQTVSSFADTDADASFAYAARRRGPVRAVIPAPLDTKAPAPAGRIVAAWGHTFGNWAKIDGNGNAAAASHRTGGFIGGLDTTFDTAFGPTLRVGLAGGFQGHAVTVNDRSSSADIETYHLAAYAATQHGPLAFRMGAAHAWHAIDTSRTIVFPGFGDTAKAAYDGRTTQIFGELGYAFAYGRFAFEPYAGLAHVRMRSDGFGETGGAAALAGTSADFDTTFSTVGVRAALPFQTAAMQDVLLKGALGWRHAFNAATPLTQLAFSAGAPFTIAGVAIARDALVTEAGFDIAWSPNTTVGVTYAGQLAGSAAEHGIKGQALRRF